MIDKQHAEKLSMRIRIGEVVCGIDCDSADDFRKFRILYSNFITENPADIFLELHIHEEIDAVQIDPESDTAFAAEYSPDKNTITAHIVKKTADDSIDMTLLNRLFYYAYYSSSRIRQYAGNTKPLLIHACGIKLNGKAVLFTGPSEAGKSTVARLLRESNVEVINDEMLVVSRDTQNNGTFFVQGTPFTGDCPERLNTAAPLDCVMILEKSRKTAIYPIDRTRAYTRFIRQIMTPSHIGQIDDKAVLSTMVDFTGELTEQVPFYVLEFNLDSGTLWREICRLKGIPEKG